jgi:hypothetical protein
METLNQALSSLVRFGVSDQLIQDLQTLEETTDLDGRPLYSQDAIYEMRCAILCRNYTKTLWEYSHYIAAIGYCHRAGVIDFFWGSNIVTSQRFKTWLAAIPASDLFNTQDQAAITLNLGKRQFCLSPKRINIMAAWTSFIVLADPNILPKFSQFNGGFNAQSIDDFSKYIKAKLDRFLEPHLQALHQQRQGRSLLRWLQENDVNSESSDYQSLIKDDSILNFWKHNAVTDDGDFKRFATVAECAYRLHHAINLGESQRSIESARSYMQDQVGEDAAWLLDEVSQIDDQDWIFETLSNESRHHAVKSLDELPLGGIKFLTNKDADFCGRFESAGDAVLQLPLTFVRAQIFGSQQSKMTEDLRKTKGSNLHALASLSVFTGFKDWQQSLSDQVEKLTQTRSAIAYILLKFGHPVAFARLLDTLTESQKETLQQVAKDDTVTMIGNYLLDQIGMIAPEPLKELEKAFAKVNRTGFKCLPEKSEAEFYVLGDEHLNMIENLLRNYTDQLSKNIDALGGLDNLETSEISIFSTMFTQLYCEEGAKA